MPIQIPIYQQRVREQGLPGVSVRRGDPVGAAVSEIGQSITQAAGAAAKIFEDVRREQDNAAINDAYAQVNRVKQKLLDDPETGFTVTRKGKDAGAAREQYEQSFDTSVRDIVKGLDPFQQQKFGQLLERERQGYTAAMDSHIVREAEAHAEQTFEAAVQSSISDAIGSTKRGDLGAAQDAIGMMLGAVDARADAKGWSDDVAQSQRAKLATQAHIGVISALLDSGDTGAAVTYLKEARASGDMDEGTLARSNIEDKIGRSSVRDFGRDTAARLFAESGGNLTKALGALDALGIKDTAKYDESRQRLNQLGSDARQAERQVDSPILGSLEKDLFSGKVYSLNDDRMDLLSEEGRGRAARMRYNFLSARGDRGASKRREQLEKDRYALALFDGLDMVGQPGQDKVSVDIERLAEQIDVSPTAVERMRGQQKRAQTNVAKDKGVSASDFGRIIDEKLSGLGMSSKKQAKIKKYVNGVYSRYVNEQKNAGIPPAQDVIDKWVADWFLRVERRFASDPLGVEAQMEGADDAPPTPFAAQDIASGVERLPLEPIGTKANRITRTDPATGETRFWNGSSWVNE